MASQKISLADWQQQLGASQSANNATPTKDHSLVYSTDGGRVVQDNTQGKANGETFKDGVVRLSRETKGRGGKAVSLIKGIGEPHAKLVEIAAVLKKKSGCGGAVKDGVIEIQGDNRELLAAELAKLGYKTKIV